jgi:hypothetical protein
MDCDCLAKNALICAAKTNDIPVQVLGNFEACECKCHLNTQAGYNPENEIQRKPRQFKDSGPFPQNRKSRLGASN